MNTNFFLGGGVVKGSFFSKCLLIAKVIIKSGLEMENLSWDVKITPRNAFIKYLA